MKSRYAIMHNKFMVVVRPERGRYCLRSVRTINEGNLRELTMDTTEELNNTYFYAGRPNLTAGELFIMIFCEEVAEQLGIDDFGAIVAILSGRNVLTTRTKPRDALKGTSYASRAARRVFPKAKFPFGIQLPTIVGGYPPPGPRVFFLRTSSALLSDGRYP
jgi:hypothetical protein